MKNNIWTRCLTSVRPYVDEMIVVDTGSEDATWEIPRQQGALCLTSNISALMLRPYSIGLYLPEKQCKML